jgi:prephenate dehydratase
VSSLTEPLPVAATTVGFLGPAGTFTEEALRATLDEQAADGRSRRFLPFPSMQDTIEAVSGGEVDCAIVPIENSIEGSVSATLDVLAHEIDNLQIVREVRHPIRHSL